MEFRALIQNLFLSTVRIESSTPEGRIVGTGFVYAHERVSLPEGGVAFFLVTNKHVVEDAEGGWFYFLGSGGPRTPALGHSVQVQAPSYADAWHGHPNLAIDIAVLYLNELLHYREEPDSPTLGEITSTAPVRSVHVPTPERIEELDAIEDIIFIGYPDGLYDELNLTPIARKGITATPLHLDYGGQPVFLIDATVFPGSSGSPVLAAPNTIRSNENRDIALVGSQMMLLGVLSSAFFTTEQGKIESGPIPTPQGMSIEVEQMIDLGYVYKSSTVLETIEDFEEKYVN